MHEEHDKSDTQDLQVLLHFSQIVLIGFLKYPTGHEVEQMPLFR